MNLNLKTLLLFTAIALSFLQVSWSQDYFPHGLGIGINGAVATNGSNFDVDHEAIGLHFDHQRNWSRFFSFRTSIEANYFLPDRNSYTSSSGSSPVNVEQITKKLNTTLSLEPILYLRTNAASFYLSLGILAGDHTQYNKRIIRSVDGEEDVSKYKDSYFIVGIKPSIGVTFHMRDNSNDIDFQFSQNLWGGFEDVIDGGLLEYGEYMYVLTIAYRFNFLKG
ncbi:hypothetical protein [Owenweeksia hongkongensis]|uniref:hypothetical protein n=1 Tax=Owenweeksia hongkongensis TaxID=253245 RepID=UPI003A9337E6